VFRLRRRLRPVLELVDDVVYVVRRFFRRLGRRIAGLPRGRGPGFRRRAALVALVLAAYAAIRVVSLPDLPCEGPLGSDCPPGDDAIALVPADAYVYAHISLDPDSDQWRNATELVDALPLIATGGGRLLAEELDLPPPDEFLRTSSSWRGNEVAFALLPGGRDPALPLTLIEVTEAERAVNDLGRMLDPDTDIAIVGEFVAVGSRSAVRAAADLERGGRKARSLSDDGTADEVRDGLPEERVADVYVSGPGIQRLLATRTGLASQLDTFTDFGASRGIAAAALAQDDGLEVELESVLDPRRAQRHPSFFAAFPAFDPSLADQFPAATFAYLGIANPAETMELVLRQAAAVAPGIAEAFDQLNRDLRREGGVDLRRTVLPLLEGQAAAGASPANGLPYLNFVFTDVDEGKARTATARLQAPLVAALGPERTGQAASFGEERVGDVSVYSVRVSAALDLSYAVFDDKLIVSTNPLGVKRAIEGGEALDTQDDYQAVISDAPDSVSALVFLDLEGLVRLAEPIGLAQIESYVVFEPDIEKLQALGVTIEAVDGRLSTKLFLEIENPAKERGD
jgi:Protein of unknown function (DUF3352)